MKQTAVDWLKDMLEWNYGDPKMLEISWVNLDDLFERAKQMEKEQMKDAFTDTHYYTPFDSHVAFEEYYKEVYGGE
jgi:hypothetical protein